MLTGAAIQVEAWRGRCHAQCRCSGAFFPGGERRCELQIAVRALDNGMEVAFAGLVGAPSAFIGGTAVYDPVGTAIARVEQGEGIAVAALDPERIAEARRSQRMWAERRSSLGARRQTRLTGLTSLR